MIRHFFNNFSVSLFQNPFSMFTCLIFTIMTKLYFFFQVVPTDIQTLSGTWRTFQYSVKELTRPIDHDTGSHGAPGIYFRYDMSALKVVVAQDREPFWRWIVKLCAGNIVNSSRNYQRVILKICNWANQAQLKKYISNQAVLQPK